MAIIGPDSNDNKSRTKRIKKGEKKKMDDLDKRVHITICVYYNHGLHVYVEMCGNSTS